MRACSILLLLVAACKPAAGASDADGAPASDPLNLSFEYGDPPVGWSTKRNGDGPVTQVKDYTISVDRAVAHVGKRSLHLTGPRDGLVRGVGVTLFQALPLDAVRGKSLRFSGWVRIASRQGGPFLRVDGPGPGTSIHSTFPVAGGTDGEWQQYAVELPIPTDAKRVVIGCSLFHEGEAWYDGFELSVDGAPL